MYKKSDMRHLYEPVYTNVTQKPESRPAALGFIREKGLATLYLHANCGVASILVLSFVQEKEFILLAKTKGVIDK